LITGINKKIFGSIFGMGVTAFSIPNFLKYLPSTYIFNSRLSMHLRIFFNCFIEINRGYVHMYTTTTKKIDDDFSNGDGTE
jgi:hypothetical protein